MKPVHQIFIWSLLVWMAQAQSSTLSSLPNCAATCFEGTASSSSCSPLNITCLCEDVLFMSTLETCESTTCTVKETLTSTNVIRSACGIPVEDISSTLIGIASSFGPLAILLYLLRIIDRLWVINVSLGLDDYFITFGVILGSALNFLLYPLAQHGLGRDFWAVSFPDINTTLELLYIAEIVYFPSEMFTQLSILAFYRRVFAKSSFVVQKGSNILIICVVVFGIANTLTIIFQCIPISYFWTGWSGETKGSCININAFSWARAAVEIVVDIAILSLPLRDLTKLQMSWRKRAQVILVFALGFAITIVSILRLQSLVHFSKTTNVTHDNAFAVYWSVLECDIFIITACLPSLRSIASQMVPRWFGRTSVERSYASRKYHRQGDIDSGSKTASIESRQHHTHGAIMKRVDLHVSHDSGSVTDGIELLDQNYAIPQGV
ncbi:hypothetical protein F5Y19DRAFT_448593 [Xylariaceae sp. FL1651]|nr:hypothetical protein F5Y19DRAFT_448593 [Xylariaceae sp. FL1651]